MTLLAESPECSTAVGPSAGVHLRQLAEHAAVGALLLWWAVPLTRATGGRQPHVLSVALLLLLPALVATRPWQRLRSVELIAASALPAAALVVCLVAPTGWRGANEIGNWAFAAGSYVVVRAYVRDSARAFAVLTGVTLAGLVEFASSWLAWWGGRNPAVPMIGTFYWHNQYAADLLVPALLGLSLAVWPRRPVVPVGWVAAPLCTAGVLFSTSRGTIMLLVAGWLAVAGLALWFPHRRAAVLRLVCATALTAATCFALTGPPFFDHRAAPSAGVAARSDRESASGNASYRTKTWAQAVDVYREFPATGTGFHGFAFAAAAATPGEPHSAFAHDAWLQALSDGGSLLGLPFLLAAVAAAVGLVRRVGTRAWKRRSPHVVVAGIAALVLAAHSLIDFDTSYPALFAALAIVTAVASARNEEEAEPVRSRRRAAVVASAVLAVVALVAVQPAWNGGLRLNLVVPGVHVSAQR